MGNRALFLPPKESPLVLGLAKQLLPAMMKWYAGGIEVEISDEDLGRLRALKRQRLLLVPNHPTHFDPMVMIEVSRRVEEDLRFVAAREVFDGEAGLRGWLFQRCGVYSLIRGAADRESFAMTQQILVEGRHWLVIFAEGEVSLENDVLLPFEPGVISLALRAQDSLGEKDSAPIHAAVVAMRTIYKPGVEEAISAALGRLEASVGLKVEMGFAGWEAMRQRITCVGVAVLAAVERSYLLTAGAADSLDQRLTTLKNRMLMKMESYLEIQAAGEMSFLDRVRVVRLKIDRIVHAYGELPEKTSNYDRRLLGQRQQAFQDFYVDLSRLINFLTLRGGYLDGATPERFAEVVMRLEQEILGKPKLVYPRKVVVRVGRIRDLREKLPEFRKDKRKTAGGLADELEQESAGLLNTMRRNAAMPAKQNGPSVQV